MFTLHNLIYEQKKLILAATIALVLVIPITYFAASKINHKEPQEEQVLGTSEAASPIPTPTPTPTPSPKPSTKPTPTPSPTPSPSPSPSPSPQTLNIQVTVDYSGASDKTADSYSTTIDPGQTAWDAIKKAIGEQNLQYTNYGGSLGIFVSGINGVAPDWGTCSCYWEFIVNGASSNVGVSSYVCNNGDTIGFRIAH